MLSVDSNKDAIGDSGASSNFVSVENAGDPSVWKRSGGVAVTANGQSMPILGTQEMQHQLLPPQPYKVLQGLDNTIISIPRLADDGFCSLFLRNQWLVIEEATLKVNENARIMAQGYREPQPGGLYRMSQDQRIPLYDVNRRCEDHELYMMREYESDDLSDVVEKCFTIGTLNTYYSQIKLRDVAERASFYHATFGYPSISALYKALARHLTLPGLTHHEFADNAPKSVHTARGHLHELPQGQGSTKPVNEILVSEKIIADPAELEKLSTERQLPRKLTPGYLRSLPDDDPIKKGEWYVYHTGKLTADATGKLPVTSYLGHTAIWVAYHPESGYIRALPIKTKGEISRMLEYMFSEQIKLGHRIDSVFIDNEVDNDARAFFAQQRVKLNQVAPYCHRANPAERAISTFKDHLIAILSGRDPSCPLSYWNEAVTHAEVTLNMMRPGPNGKSAYEAYWARPYDLSMNPMVPWGTRCEAYVPKALRTTYGYRSQPSFYVGASYSNYRGHRLISMDTDKKAAVHVRHQVVFYPHDVKFMRWTEMADLKERVSDLSKTLVKVHGKTNEATANAAEALKAYCDAMIMEPDSEADELMVSGAGIIHWLGPQMVDTVTGTVVYELEQPPEEAPPPVPSTVSAEQQPTPQPATPTPVASTPQAVEQTPAQMLGLEPEPEAPEQIPILGHARVSEGVQLNTEAQALEGADVPPDAESIDIRTRHQRIVHRRMVENEDKARAAAALAQKKKIASAAEKSIRKDKLIAIAKTKTTDPNRINVVV
jgi:hypothetical protein